MCEAREYKAIGYTDQQFYKEYYVDYDNYKAQNTRQRQHAGHSDNELTLEQLVDEFVDNEKKGFYEYTLRSRYLQDFSPIVDPDLIPQNDVVEYMRDHIQKVIRVKKDETPSLD